MLFEQTNLSHLFQLGNHSFCTILHEFRHGDLSYTWACNKSQIFNSLHFQNVQNIASNIHVAFLWNTLPSCWACSTIHFNTLLTISSYTFYTSYTSRHASHHSTHHHFYQPTPCTNQDYVNTKVSSIHVGYCRCWINQSLRGVFCFKCAVMDGTESMLYVK